MKVFGIILLLALIVGIFVFKFKDRLVALMFAPRGVATNSLQTPGANLKTEAPKENDIQIIAKNLDIPWEIVFLPSGDMLVTERAGKVLKIGTQTKVIKEIEGVRHIGEGGLLGMALHPDFEKNNFIYLYSTTQNGGAITNRVERYKLSSDVLSDKVVIIEGIKGSSNHDGGRIAFGPDKYLYVTTGDAETPSLAQDKNSVNGKILRLKDDGGLPDDNPFGNSVYSWGHRNAQGITWDSRGTMWATEHGPSGTQTGHDEVNTIIKGANYGWPTVRGAQTREGLTAPIIQSGKEDTWAPSGATYWDGSIFFSGLRGEALYELKIKEGNKLITHLKKEYGRLRTVIMGKDGFMYIATNNTDGRGIKKDEDDKIIKINPKIFR